MKTTIKVFSIIAIVLGSLAIFGAITEVDSDSVYAFLGGAFLLSYGIVTFNYLGNSSEKKRTD